MNRREVSLEFLRAFCAGDVESLNPLLTDDFRFEGPFYRCDSRAEYIRSLREDPPEADSHFDVLRIFEDGDDVCVFYEYWKSQGALRIAQWNRFRGDKIAQMILVFDGRHLV